MIEVRYRLMPVFEGKDREKVALTRLDSTRRRTAWRQSESLLGLDSPCVGMLTAS